MEKLRCAIYCRVSTEIQRESDTIEGQRQQLHHYAQQQGWEIAGAYEDEGISGTVTRGRGDFMRLLTHTAEGRFDLWLVAEHSRVTRTGDPEERGRLLKLLKDTGTRLASPAEGTLDLSMFSGELMTTLKFMFAAEEKEEFVRRSKRGRQAKLSQGIYCLNSLPYGLRKVVDKSVKPMKHEVIIDPDENQVLRTVYDLIVKQGWSINNCSRYLNENDIHTRRGKTWNVGSLSAILRNEGGLTGTMYAGRYQWKTEAGKQKLIGVKPRSEAVTVQVPAIFSKEEFARLREKIEANKRDHLITKEGFLLRGKLRCAMCGAKYVPTSGGNVRNKAVRYYACYNRVKSPKRREPGEKPCHAPFVNMQVLDHQVERNLLIDLFMRPEKTLKGWTSNKAQVHKLERIEGKLKRVENDMAINDRAAGKLLRGFLQELFTEEQLEREQAGLQGQRKLLEEERLRLQQERTNAEKLQVNLELVQSSSEQIKQLAKEAYGKFKSMSFQDKQRLIGHLIPPGTFLELYPCREDEIRLKKVPGMKRRVKIDWDYSYTGLLNLHAVVHALQVYVKTGEMLASCVSYIEVGYESLHGGVTGEEYAGHLRIDGYDLSQGFQPIQPGHLVI